MQSEKIHFILSDSSTPMLAAMLLISISESCNLPDYPRVLDKEDTAMAYTLSERGMTKFIADGMAQASAFLNMMNIPDQVFELNLGVTTIMFSITDMGFKDLSVGFVEAALNDQPDMNAALRNMNAQILFQWAFQQQSPPYLGDSGSGTVYVRNMDLKVNVAILLNRDDCPGHYNVKINRATIDMESINIKLEGGNSWLYQSMLDLIIKALTDNLTGSLTEVLVQVVQKTMDDYMRGSGYYLEYSAHPGIYQDDRFTDDVEVRFKYIAIRYSGYCYKWDNLTDEYIKPEMMDPNTIMNYVNTNMQFIIYEAGLQNNLYIFQKYTEAYNVPHMFNTTSMPIIKICGNCVTLNVSVESNGTSVDFFLKGLFKQHTDEEKDPDTGTRNVTYIYFDLVYISHELMSQPTAQFNETLLVQELPKLFTQQYKTYGYMIVNTPFMDMDLFHVMYHPENRVIRLFLI